MPDRKNTLSQSAVISPFAVIEGTPGPDELNTLADGDILYGLGGNDRLSSRFNMTALHGGTGNDTLRMDHDFLLPGGQARPSASLSSATREMTRFSRASASGRAIQAIRSSRRTRSCACPAASAATC